jgi:uronate dehydrogenase
MHANILGLHHLYEAVHKRGVKRVIYASSSHVVGYYPTTQVIDATAPLRPDGMYGISKCFGEALSRYYFDRFGIETVCLRIGSSFEEPRNARMMVTFLAYDDLVELVRCALFTPRVGHTIAFGVGQCGALVGQPRGGAPGLCAAAQFEGVCAAVSGER